MTNEIERVAGSRGYKKPQTFIVDLTTEARTYLLGTRKLTLETLDAYGVGCTVKGNIAIPFKDEKGETQLVKFRSPTGGTLELGDRKLKTFIEPGGKPILLGSHMAHHSAGPLVICFGDYDAMSVYQDGVANATSLPFGDSGFQFIDLQWDFLETFHEVIIFADNDEFKNIKAEAKAREKLEELVTRLGKHRVKIVKLTSQAWAKDANELLIKFGTGACAKAVEDANWYPEAGLIKVADFVEADFVPGRKTGFRFVDENAGGFGEGHLVLIGGDNSAGKTTVALKLIAETVEQSVAVLYWSGEQRVGRIRYWFERIAAGPEHLKKVVARETGFKLWFPEDDVQPYIRDWYRDWFYQYTDFFIDAPKFFEVAELAIKRHGVKTIIIDNLMAFTGGESENYLQAQGDFVQSCKMFAERWAVVVILIVHNRKHQGKPSVGVDVPGKDDIEGSKKITNWADTILQIYRIPKDAKAEEKWADVDGVIHLCKNRENGTEGYVNTVIDAKSNRIVEYHDREYIAREYRWHAAFKGRGLLEGQ